MERTLLQQLTTGEIDYTIHELNHAVEAHIAWFARINRHLIFASPPSDIDLSEQAEQHCTFGRWYQSVETPELRNNPLFVEIGDIHKKAHESARELLSNLQQSTPISTGSYDAFVRYSDALRNTALRLRMALKRDQGLVTKLMLKVFENAGEGVIITDPRTHILRVNSAFTHLTGYREDEVAGQKPAILSSGRQSDDFYQVMWRQLNESGHWEGEIWNRRKNGDIYLEWLSIAAVNDNSGNVTHYVAIFSDITRSKDNEQQLRHLAHFDQLTQLPNRTLFLDRLHHAMAMARREDKQIAVLFLDLDGFKAVNDSLGHTAGDELLRQVARRLRENLRESDTVSRFGGDEFTVVLPDVSGREGVAFTAAKLIDAIAQPYIINGHSTRITTSLGISLYPAMADTSEKVITQADMAMYHAKNNGKNHYEFFEADFEDEV